LPPRRARRLPLDRPVPNYLIIPKVVDIIFHYSVLVFNRNVELFKLNVEVFYLGDEVFYLDVEVFKSDLGLDLVGR
jgi:hypothetical protein